MSSPQVNFTKCTDQFSAYGDHSTSCANVAENDHSQQLDVVYAVIETLVAICAIVGNGLVIIAFSREKRLRKRTNCYIISLACADFLVGFLGIPFAILVSKDFFSHASKS